MVISFAHGHRAGGVLAVPLAIGVLMPRTVEAVIDENGEIRLLESLPLRARQRVLVTILDEEAKDVHEPNQDALLSEAALAEDWNRDEEDQAWSHLQPEQ
jgi:hypothetical protein